MFNSLIYDPFFREFFEGTPARAPTTGFPVVDHYNDKDGNAVLEFALAGYKAEDLNVSVEGNKITVSSDCSESECKEPQRRIARRKFTSSYTDANNTFDLQKLEASFVDGILRIEIPKKDEAKPKVFTISKERKALTE